MSLLIKLKKLHKIPNKIYRSIERAFNKLHAYDYPDTADGWEKIGKNPVFGNEKTGSIFDPYVLKDKKKYILFASERKSGSIIRLESINGKTWENKSICLNGGHFEWNAIVNRACVIKKDEIWHMWFTGQTNNNSTIGYATSKDGIIFQPALDKPVLKPLEIYEGDSVMNPCVLWDEKNKIYKMWYSAGEDYEPDIICYAESMDGISWCRYPEPVMRPNKNTKYSQYKLGGCDVKYINGKYIMFYIGYQNLDVARICKAISTDGIHWCPSLNNPIISPTRNSWDADAIYKPSVILEEKAQLMWYNGRHKRQEYIGFAIHSIIQNKK